jgi:hypothetical protein
MGNSSSLSACTREGPTHKVSIGYNGETAGVSYQYSGEKITGCPDKSCPDRQPGGFNAPKDDSSKDKKDDSSKDKKDDSSKDKKDDSSKDKKEDSSKDKKEDTVKPSKKD